LAIKRGPGLAGATKAMAVAARAAVLLLALAALAPAVALAALRACPGISAPTSLKQHNTFSVLSVTHRSLIRQRALREDNARQNLREADRLRAEQLAVGKAAAGRAERAGTEASRLALERVEAAAKLQQADAATLEVAARIDALAAKQRDAERRLKARAAGMQPLLPLIERLSLYPVETLLATPAPPEAALRGLMVLRALSRQMEIEAEALRRDQAELDAAREELAAEAPRLAEARAAQSRAAASLDRQIAAAHAERAKAEAEASRAASETAGAAARMETLRGVLGALEAQARADAAKARQEAERAGRPKRPPETQAARQRAAMLARPAGAGSIAGGGFPAGQLQAPVTGIVVKGWGQETEAGPATGLSYHAPPAARVVSPCGGRVVFADTFRSYGLLLIVDCGDGFHVVLSGFDRLDVRLGQTVVAAEPVGVMPSWEPGSTANRPALYVELRHGGQPVDPASWRRSRG